MHVHWVALLFRPLIVLALIGGIVPLRAYGDPDSVSLSTDRMREIVTFLEDSQQVRRTADQLRLLLEAREMVASPRTEENGQPLFPRNLFDQVDHVQHAATQGMGRFRAELEALMLSSQRLKDSISRGEYRQRLIFLLLLILFAAAVGACIGAVMRIVGGRLESGGTVSEAPEDVRQWARGVFRSISSLAPAAAIASFVLVLGAALPLQPPAREGGKRILWAFLAYAVFRTLITVIVSPRNGTKRLVALSDEAAKAIARLLRGPATISFVAYLVYAIASVLDRRVLAEMAITACQLAILVFLATALVRHRKNLQQSLLLGARPGEPHWEARLKAIGNYGISQLHLIVIALMVVGAGIGFLGRQGDFRFFVFALLRSLVSIAGAVAAGLAWTRFVSRCYPAYHSSDKSHPAAGERITHYLYLGRVLGNLTLIALAGTYVLDVWGMDLYGWFGGHSRILVSSLHILVILVAGIAALEIGYFAIRKIQSGMAARMSRNEQTSSVEIQKRVSTLGGVLRKMLLVAVVVVVVMTVLDELGFDIKPMLAGVGIVGLAVGFGAQNLVRDIISGLFVIFENRIRVGDVAVINGAAGLVEQVNLRSSVLRGLDGTVHVFPNGAITSLSNMTHDFSYYVLDIGVAYKEDTDRVTEVLKQLGDEIIREEPYRSVILEPLEILGVDSFGDSAVMIKARIKTVPIQQWFVGRELNRRIKKRFDELGIEIPFPHQSVYFGESSKPVRLSLEGGLDREQLRNLVRETVREMTGSTEEGPRG